MKDLDRIVQKQIDEATRTKQGRVKVKDTAQIANLGKGDQSGQPIAPNIMWRVEDYTLPLGLWPNFNDARAAVNNEVSPNRTVTTIPGLLDGGFNTFLNSSDIIGVTRIFSTKIFASSSRNFSTRLKGHIYEDHKVTITSNAYISAMLRTEDSDGTPSGDFPNWIALSIISGDFGGDSFDLEMRGSLHGWATIALFLYGGHTNIIDVKEAFNGLVWYLDATEFKTDTPPAPPTWGNPAITSEYIDESIGTSKNTLKINTPPEGDWLGVGIYRAEPEPSSDFVVSGRDTMVRATTTRNTDLGRDYYWTIYDSNPLVGPTERYVFSNEQLYKANLITNGQFDYDTANWRFTNGAGGAGDIIKQVIHTPLTGPRCLKASAAYDGGSTWDMVITSSTFAIDVSKSYKLEWYIKTVETPGTGFAPGSSNPISALQINYYDDDSHTLDYSTPYQIINYSYLDGEGFWTKHEATINRATYGGSANPGGVTGASALSEFILPSACAYIDINFKMWDNHSAEAIYYFDGANCEVDSGQSLSYSTAIADGVVLRSTDNLTLQEATSYGAARMPFLGATTGGTGEVFATHSAYIFGDEEYRSSAHWAKFSKGIEFAPDVKNRLFNGSFRHWTTGTDGNAEPVDWSRWEVGTWSQSYCWPTTHTSVYKADDLYGDMSTSGCLGFYFPDVEPQGVVNWGGLRQGFWGGAAANYPAYSGWIMLSTGRVVVGDYNALDNVIQEKWFVLQGTPNGYYWDKAEEVILEKDKWTHFYIPLNSAFSMGIRSDTPGTVAYFDGVQANVNVQGSGDTRGYPTLFDTQRNTRTDRPESYAHCSSNSLTKEAWTIRCWYTPAYDWNVKSSASGYCQMPHPTIWSFGDDLAEVISGKLSWLSYRPWHNAASSGGYFQWQGNDFPNNAITRSPRTDFKAMDPVHLVVTYYGRENEGNNAYGENCKIYVNGVEGASVNGQFMYGFNSIAPYDNFVIGAFKGAETDTAKQYMGFDVTTSYGNANGVISDFRVDNFVWGVEQVAQDYEARKPRPAPSSPTMTLSNIRYTHLGDRIKDGSETQTFDYEDLGVSIGTYYSYALDAFDYLNNRSLLGDTASITAGDTVGPNEAPGYTSTAYTINKDTHLTFSWTNPTDADFSHTEIRWMSDPGTRVDKVYGIPGRPCTWSPGFVGWGFDDVIALIPYDHAGNAGQPPTFPSPPFDHIRGRTYKGPIRRIDGSFFPSRGYGLQDQRNLLVRADAVSWGRVYTTTENPGSVNYSDLTLSHFANDDPTPSLIESPMLMGSVTGLSEDTDYYMYAIDSASGRANALRMQWTTDVAVAHGIDTYPLGQYFSGNIDVRGYFIPDQAVGQFSQGSTIVSPYLESQTGSTYLDLRNAVFHSGDRDGNWTEIRSDGIYQYEDSFETTHHYPIIFNVPASSVYAGLPNNPATDWGLPGFINPPKITLTPYKIPTYCSTNALGFGPNTAQSVIMNVNDIQSQLCIPKVFLSVGGPNDDTSEAHVTANVTKPRLGSSVAYDYPVELPGEIANPFVSYGGTEGCHTTCAYDSATGYNNPGYTGVILNGVGSTVIGRIDTEIEFTCSAAPAGQGYHMRLGWMDFFCSADSNQYDGHNNHSGSLFNHIFSPHQYEFSVRAGASRETKVLSYSNVFNIPAMWKPMYKLSYTSVAPMEYDGQGVAEILFSNSRGNGYVATAGMYYLNDFRIRRVTYYTQEGALLESTGYGIVGAIVYAELFS